MPHIPQDVLDRIASLERQVKQLAGRANIRPALNQVLSGDVVIGEGGQLMVRAEGGVEHFKVGDIPSYYDDTEFGTILRRRDGSIALSIWNGQDAVNPQVIRIKDAKGNEILAENIEQGGLHRPHLAQPWFDVQPVRWPKTESWSWETLQEAHIETEHGKLRVFAQKATVGNGGELRLLINDQEAAKGDGFDDTYTVPNFTYGQLVAVQLQARRTDAAEAVWATFSRVHGVG
ncbi:hypothetical protein [Streptomyces antarcticus]|uniref:hypothetical protein n=1 Tax=Streptomyces antarcticus TaxID=2996458 RepID=UPI0022703151|nr:MULTISPECIES: hypothetical protein [unclassified Streptomyces]MCY0942608.1 hypothetical protein [Streptomyces sp. H34-AA3]MCZ4081354.1 hypothetical protein [Streptomyces sp. H34-S5]